MVTLSTLTKSNESVECHGQRTVVSGATQGIGAGIALRFALAGASVWIVGRSQEKADGVLDRLRQASAEAERRRSMNSGAQSKGGGAAEDHSFFQADLSKAAEVKRVAEDIASKAGERGIDHLFECQGGPPTGRMKPPSSDTDPEFGFAVQCLSRFGLAKLLTEKNVIKQGVSFIAAPGNGGSKPFDTEDPDFSKAQAAGKVSEGWALLFKQLQRDSTVLDSVCQVRSGKAL